MKHKNIFHKLKYLSQCNNVRATWSSHRYIFQEAKPITEDVKTSVEELVIAGNSMEKLMKVFVQQGRNSSDTFLFWDNYITDWAQLLLDYIASKRDNNKDMELETFAEMLPVDFMCGHQNYAR